MAPTSDRIADAPATSRGDAFAASKVKCQRATGLSIYAEAHHYLFSGLRGKDIGDCKPHIHRFSLRQRRSFTRPTRDPDRIVLNASSELGFRKPMPKRICNGLPNGIILSMGRVADEDRRA